jgi:hypothetical protein
MDMNKRIHAYNFFRRKDAKLNLPHLADWGSRECKLVTKHDGNELVGEMQGKKAELVIAIDSIRAKETGFVG